jgi:type 1 glutamine amidotransferase/sugar phosphate isomerase/epimerase
MDNSAERRRPALTGAAGTIYSFSESRAFPAPQGATAMAIRLLPAGLIVIVLPALTAPAQTSSPTPMTPRIMRGPEWSRLRTAMPAIIAGRYLGGGRGGGPTTWNSAASLAGFGQATLFDALDRQIMLFVRDVEGDGAETVSPEIPKKLDYHLTAEEIDAVKKKLSSVGVRMVAYDLPSIGPDEAGMRPIFEFARALGVLTIVSQAAPEALPAIDKLANEFQINVAIRDNGDPRKLPAAIGGLSKRVGVSMDTADWMRKGVQPVDGLKMVNDRLMAVHLLDRAAPGESGRNVTLGSGAAGIPAFLDAMYRMQIQPSFLAVEYTGSGDALADMTKSFDAYERALQPIAGDRVNQISKTTPIRGPGRLTEKDRAGIEAAVPATASATPKKPRKLLVIDLNVAYPGHGSIPAANLAVELWGRKTGAYTAIEDNNLDNLKYPKIQEFDAVFLNNTVGQIFPDPEIRQSLMRFIREGGGLAGYHGSSHASIDWTEFGDMLAARAGSHRDFHEKATLKLDDPASPLVAAFHGQEFEWQDEFFRFTTPPYSRDKIHVLLSFDAAKTDMHQKPDCDICDRADNDIAVSWIRSYGKGRIFYATIGHLPTLFETPSMAQFFLAGLQFVLGDLEADTTPSAGPASRK